MRAIILLSLLFLTACTIREETFSPRDERSSVGGISLNEPDLNTPIGQEDERERLTCTGGFAQGSRIDEHRDGSANLFCE